MKAYFFLSLLDQDDRPISGWGENLVLDAGIEALRGHHGQGMFYLPRLLIGGSDYPAKPEQPGLLKPLYAADAGILTATQDNHDPYVFFTAYADFAEDEATGRWAEMSFNGWNRSLFTAPASLPDGLYGYAVTAYNAHGESPVSTIREAIVSSPPCATGLQARRGATALPNRVELLTDSPQTDTIQVHFMTLSWATGVSGCLKWVAARRPDVTDLAHTFAIAIGRDGLYYYEYDGFRMPLDPQPIADQERTFALPASGTGERWRARAILDVSAWPRKEGDDAWRRSDGSIATEAEFFGDQPVVRFREGSFGTTHQAYYSASSALSGPLMPYNQVALPAGYGYNPAYDPGGARYAFDFIGAPDDQIDPTLYPGDRPYHVPFQAFWRSGQADSFDGEVFEQPGVFRLTMWKGAQEPGADDMAEIDIYGAGRTGGAFLEWAHVDRIGPGGWPEGYRVYRRKPDGTLGRLADLPAAFARDPQGVMRGSGDTHFWDRGEVAPDAAPAPSFTGAAAIDGASFVAQARAGMLPKPLVKDGMMRGRLSAQIFFYDFNANDPTGVTIAPHEATVRAGESLVLTGHVVNDYGEPMPGLTLDWSAPSGGTIAPSPDTTTASFGQTTAGVYAVQASYQDAGDACTVTVVPGDMASLALGDPALTAGVEGGWDGARETLSLTLPEGGAGSAQVPVSGLDAYGNAASAFARNWSLDGTSQRDAGADGAYVGPPHDVETPVARLTGDGVIELLAPGAAIIEVREILDGGQPSPVTRSFSLSFSWR
jgi:hypothetical protein